MIAQRAKDKTFEGQITIDLKDSKQAIDLIITDNGEGLVSEVEDRIFDPLFTTKDPETNSGLGLTLALQIVKEHNGTIRVSSSKDENLSLNLRFFKSEVQSGLSEF